MTQTVYARTANHSAKILDRAAPNAVTRIACVQMTSECDGELNFRGRCIIRL
ncbi:hypothetical protein Mapa_005608 [Marchantia paleacea]|nr:hypothetical protein Mapa_005608 [Marchantia paleacea]